MALNLKSMLSNLLDEPEVVAERFALEQGAVNLAVKLAEAALRQIPVIGGMVAEGLDAAEPAIEGALGIGQQAPGSVPAVDVGELVRAELAKMGLRMPARTPAPTQPVGARVSPAGGPIPSEPVAGEGPTPAQLRRQQVLDGK